MGKGKIMPLTHRWADCDIERVRGMLKAGMGYSAIAAAFGDGTTRSMIAGIHHRRIKDVRCKSLGEYNWKGKHLRKCVPRVRPIVKVQAEKPAQKPVTPIPYHGPVKLLHAGPTDCRFPIGDARELTVCGAQTSGHHYCRQHRLIAFQSAKIT